MDMIRLASLLRPTAQPFAAPKTAAPNNLHRPGPLGQPPCDTVTFSGKTSKTGEDLPIAEGLNPIPSLISSMLEFAKQDPALSESWKNTLGDIPPEKDQIDSVIRLQSLMGFKGEGLSEDRKNLFRKLLENLADENPSLTPGQEIILCALLFLPVSDTQWKQHFSPIRARLKADSDDSLSDLVPSMLVSVSKEQRTQVEPVLTLHDLLATENEKDASLKDVTLLRMWYQALTNNTQVSTKRLEKTKDLLAAAQTNGADLTDPRNLDAFDLLNTLPVSEKRWNELVKKIEANCTDDDPLPLADILWETLSGPQADQEAWVEKVDQYFEKYDFEDNEVWLRGHLNSMAYQINSPFAETRLKTIQQLLKLLDENTSSEISITDYNYFNQLFHAEISDDVWRHLISPLKDAFKRDDVTDSLQNALKLAHQYILSLPNDGSPESQQRRETAKSFLQENRFSEILNPYFRQLLELKTQPGGKHKTRLKSYEALLQQLMPNAKYNEHTNTALELYLTLPIDEAEWHAVTDGVLELLKQNRSPDLIEVMVETLLNDETPQAIPLAWMQQLRDVVEKTKHPKAAYVTEQQNLAMEAAAIPSQRKNRLTQLLAKLWNNKTVLAPADQSALRLLAAMPCSEALWNSVISQMESEFATQKKWNSSALLLKNIDALDEGHSHYPMWLGELKAMLTEAGHKDMSAIDMRLEYIDPVTSSVAGSDPKSRTGKIRTLVNDWLKQKTLITEKEKAALDILAKAPFNDTVWEKAFSQFNQQIQQKKFDPVTLLSKAFEEDPLLGSDLEWMKRCVEYFKKFWPHQELSAPFAFLKNTLGDVTLSNDRKKMILNFIKGKSLGENDEWQEINLALLKLMAYLPVDDEKWVDFMAGISPNASWRQLATALVPWFNQLAIYGSKGGPEDTDSEKLSIDSGNWSKLYQKWLDYTKNNDFWITYKNDLKQFESLEEVLPLLKANTEADLEKYQNLTTYGSQIFSPTSSYSSYDDDDDPYSTPKYGGYASKPATPAGGFSDDEKPIEMTPAQRAAAKILFTNYPRSLFTMGLTMEELADMGVDKDALHAFYDPIYKKYGVDSFRKPLNTLPSASAAKANPTSGKNSPQDILARFPQTLGLLYLKAAHGDEQAFVELTSRLLHSKNALKIMAPMLSKLESSMDSYYSNHSRGKGIHPNEAELMLLLKTQEAQSGAQSVNRLTSMITSIDRFINYSLRITHRITQTWGDIGLLSHGFRFWRFDTIGGPKSFFAKFGFKAAPNRTTDATFGKGYLLKASDNPLLELDPATRIEFRRGYLVVTHPNHGTLLIRNSSFIFGRDLLPHPAYYSPYGLSESELLNLDPQNNKSLQKILDPQLYRQSGFLEHLEFLTRQLKNTKNAYGQWKFNPEGFDAANEFNGDTTDGMRTMVEWLSEQYAEWELGLNPKKPPVLAMVPPEFPPNAGYEFADQNGLLHQNYALTPARIEELQDRMNGTWSTEKYPYSDWVSFIQEGVAKKAELVLMES